MIERSLMVEWVRAELMGSIRITDSEKGVIAFADKVFEDPSANRSGPLFWRPNPNSELQEILYYDGESPHRRYGCGLLFPGGGSNGGPISQSELARQHDPLGCDVPAIADESLPMEEHDIVSTGEDVLASTLSVDDDFDVNSPDVWRSNTLGISFRAKLEQGQHFELRFPFVKRFWWQDPESAPFQLNGRYEQCKRRFEVEGGRRIEHSIWRRYPVTEAEINIPVVGDELRHGKKITKKIGLSANSPLELRFEIFPREIAPRDWIITVVLRNSTVTTDSSFKEQTLYQTHFELVFGSEDSLQPYPESERPFEELDLEEQSMGLLYRDSEVWAVGHGCAAGWERFSGKPNYLYADCFPIVELPTVTADVRDADGNPMKFSMRNLADLSEDGSGVGWSSLSQFLSQYEAWIATQKSRIATDLPRKYESIASIHLTKASDCLRRMKKGLELLKTDADVRESFKLANKAMLLQQISTKGLKTRSLRWDDSLQEITPSGQFNSPLKIFQEGAEGPSTGHWRAFQLAFLLMSIDGVQSGTSFDREVVDLIWFPTGGGKTEAYMGVIAFLLLHQRSLQSKDGVSRDGTNVLMRYTLRMLTTQQFQRAAALICALEVIRRDENSNKSNKIPGNRYSLGLWLGRDGSPNDAASAKTAVRKYRDDKKDGNPLVLTECPWCRAQLGKCSKDQKPAKMPESTWRNRALVGISLDTDTPRLFCSDPNCDFGDEDPNTWLPVEVIDTRIYQYPPSLLIGTADKFAMLAYRPLAGRIFGKDFNGAHAHRFSLPPALVVQDELHLISGPLGTMYAFYEAVIEKLCTYVENGVTIRPKIISSTATIRGADRQVKALYNRDSVNLFPSPGLCMSDSFFGVYAKKDGELMSGRLYLGLHATNYGSALTTQVRLFSSAIFRPSLFNSDKRDPWWTLLAFFNSIRELGGAKTLFDSDVRSRLKFVFNREGIDKNKKRNLRIVEELTSRLSQSEIVKMMDTLSIQYSSQNSAVVDACLASNIIEVGVDIDRLSLMAVVGQPKTTAQYIQVTGRVGRRPDERPGLIFTIYNPAKNRDRSHFEQFHSYHRRLYERVEPTSATPFAISAIQRALPGAVITWARQTVSGETNHVSNFSAYSAALNEVKELLLRRCEDMLEPTEFVRAEREIEESFNMLVLKWKANPQNWEAFPQKVDGEYLMLWPGQYATNLQKINGVQVASSMRQVDSNSELLIVPLDSYQP